MASNAAVVRKRSVLLAGHKTSVSLEQPFWDELQAIAKRRTLKIGALVLEVDQLRRGENLSSSLRLYVLADLKRQLGREAADA
jgi:predicted DNA-binding ribbon-helix-helix protein